MFSFGRISYVFLVYIINNIVFIRRIKKSNSIKENFHYIIIKKLNTSHHITNVKINLLW